MEAIVIATIAQAAVTIGAIGGSSVWQSLKARAGMEVLKNEVKRNGQRIEHVNNKVGDVARKQQQQAVEFARMQGEAQE